MTPPIRKPHIDPEVRKLQEVLDRLLANHSGVPHPPRKVLEAGCGSLTHLELDNAYLVGIDVSQKQRARNLKLSEAICGDIQTYDLPVEEFDIIICWDVLEHVSRPQQAIRNFVKAVKPGGIIILALPNVFSIKGILAKLTPHRFHIWAYRRFWGVTRAGTEDLGPFRTYLRLATRPGSVKRFASRHGLQVAYFSAYESLMQRRFRINHPRLSPVFGLLGAASKLITLGRVDVNHSDYILVLRKPERRG
jgi:2-polyprenyl-3-methyl-5-hydroxy-6-metoxy-1,4-benzoquinol methylase